MNRRNVGDCCTGFAPDVVELEVGLSGLISMSNPVFVPRRFVEYVGRMIDCTDEMYSLSR